MIKQSSVSMLLHPAVCCSTCYTSSMGCHVSEADGLATVVTGFFNLKLVLVMLKLWCCALARVLLDFVLHHLSLPCKLSVAAWCCASVSEMTVRAAVGMIHLWFAWWRSLSSCTRESTIFWTRESTSPFTRETTINLARESTTSRLLAAFLFHMVAASVLMLRRKECLSDGSRSCSGQLCCPIILQSGPLLEAKRYSVPLRHAFVWCDDFELNYWYEIYYKSIFWMNKWYFVKFSHYGVLFLIEID